MHYNAQLNLNLNTSIPEGMSATNETTKSVDEERRHFDISLSEDWSLARPIILYYLSMLASSGRSVQGTSLRLNPHGKTYRGSLAGSECSSFREI